MSDPKAWFLVMTPEDANRPDTQWIRPGAVSFGKVVVRPIAPEGWGAMIAFGAVLVAATLAIWLWGFRSGTYSLAFAILATVLVVLVIAIGFARLVRARMTQLPPGS
jgi:hypothetical protein